MNTERRPLQAIVYLLFGSAFIGLITIRVLLVVWGVPLHPLLLVALLGAIALAAGGGVSFVLPERGRLIAAGGLAVLLVVCFPWLISIVPEQDTIPSPLAYLAVIGYVLVAAFASFYPTRSRLSVFAFVLLLLSGVVTLGVTYHCRTAFVQSP